MCLAVVAPAVVAGFPLVLLHNREELPGRPTSRSLVHARGGGAGGAAVLCARDLEAGGSWLGLGALAGGLVALTNHRSRLDELEGRGALGEPSDGARSRGRLVLELAGRDGRVSASAAAALDSLGEARDAAARVELGARYMGFNAVWADAFRRPERVAFVSNRPHARLPGGGVEEGRAAAAALLQPGEVHGFANAMLNDDEREPRVAAARREVRRELEAFEAARAACVAPEPARARALAARLLRVMTAEPAFVPGGEAPTRSQTLVIVGVRDVHYFFRHTDGADGVDAPLEHVRVARPPPR